MSISINVDYTKHVGDIIKRIFVADDRCHGNKGEHLTGVMMGFAPNIMGCLHDYRVLITTTIPISVTRLKEIEASLLSNVYEVEEVNVTITNYKYVDFRLEMGLNSSVETYGGFRNGVHIITLGILMGIGCEQERERNENTSHI